MAKTKKADGPIHFDQRKQSERRNPPERRIVVADVSTERRVIQRRQKVNRRRQIDPTTCERDYTDAEIEFMHALDKYKRANGRMFPTCSEILEVLRDLGYEKTDRSRATVHPSHEECCTPPC